MDETSETRQYEVYTVCFFIHFRLFNYFAKGHVKDTTKKSDPIGSAVLTDTKPPFFKN